MPSADILLAFLLATSIFAYMPGPSTLYAAAQTIARGRRAGWSAALGIHLGGYVHVLTAALGLAVLFEAVPPLYLAMKLVGAAYLVWLGVRLWRRRATDTVDATPVPPRSARRAFWESVTVEMLNPKTALFYLAFLPQFADPTADFAIWAQLLILGTVVNLMFSSADVLCVLLADQVTARLSGKAGAGRVLQRLGGGILIGLGLKLAVDSR